MIPLCHPLALTKVDIQFELDPARGIVRIQALSKVEGNTGVEVEALTAVAVAGLTVIDMVKALDPSATITDVKMIHKDGGRNGEWTRS